jgi:hypothetical protein
VINPSQRPLPDNTQNSQQTDIHALGGIRIHDPSKLAAVDPRLRPRGHYYYYYYYYHHYYYITFTQGIHNYIPETNHLSRVYSVAATLYLQFMVQVTLFRVLNLLYFNIRCSSVEDTGQSVDITRARIFVL